MTFAEMKYQILANYNIFKESIIILFYLIQNSFNILTATSKVVVCGLVGGWFMNTVVLKNALAPTIINIAQ